MSPTIIKIYFAGTVKTGEEEVVVECGICNWKRVAIRVVTKLEEVRKKGHDLLNDHFLSLHATWSRQHDRTAL